MIALFSISLLSCFESSQSTVEKAAVVETEGSSHGSGNGIEIRVGWQETWATQGQLAVLLKEKSILNELGFEP